MNLRLLWAACAAVLATTISSCGGGGSGGVGVAPVQASSGPVELAAVVTRVESYQPPAPERAQSASLPPTTAAAKAERPAPFRVRLPPAAARRAADLRRGAGIPAQIGIARDVAATSSRAAMAQALKWRHGPSRSAAAMSFASEGAAALRLGLLVNQLPGDAVVRGYVQGGDTAFEIPGRAILETIQRNRDAGDLSDAGRTYWTPAVDSDEVTLEIVLPPGSPADAVEVSVPRLSHLHVKTTDLNRTQIGQAGTCEVDVSCVAAADNTSRSTAMMIFTTDAGTFLCTGTLLNDSSSSGTPYFMSANHCISSQTVASSLATYWFYRSTSCNSGIANSPGKLQSGATLLYASATTDTSFMRLNASPPAGAVFAGWSIDTPALGADVIGVHHPEGDLQKISQGWISAFATCSAVDAESFMCRSPNDPSTATFVNANWRSGTTEVGSSGSGLFAGGSGNRYFVGQLYGGSASCSLLSGTSWYGRFDKAYFAALSRWLSPLGPPTSVTPRVAIYRFYNGTTGAHFFTPSTAERDAVIAGLPQFSYEGVAFYGYGSQVPGSSPVYRFYNTRTGRHFFTITVAERDAVLATMPDYRAEGVGWYAQIGSGGAATPVYRFNNPSRETHFYTITELEKQAILQYDLSWHLEGIGFYAWLTQ